MPKTARLGVLEQVATAALKEMLKSLDENDDWQDLIEEALVETDIIAANLIERTDDEAMDAFYKRLDKFQDRVLTRAGRALINLMTNQPDPVALAYTEWLEEKPTQT